MGEYLRSAGATGGVAGSLAGVTDLVLAPIAGGSRLFAVAGHGGSVYAADPARALSDAGFAARSAVGWVASGGLDTLTLAGRPVLLAYGGGTTTNGYWLDGVSPLSGGFALGTDAQTLLAAAALPLDSGGDLVMTTSLQQAGVGLWIRSPSGVMTRSGTLATSSGASGYDLVDIATAQVGASRFLLAVSALTHAVAVWSVDGAGRATLTDTLSAHDGLSVAAPSRLVTIEMDGRSLVLVAAPGTGSVTVAELDSGGRLTILDQVNDTLETRFQDIQVLDAITLNGRVFVVAGGTDDGLTVMTLLPDGRLVHLETLAGSLALPLDNPAALELGLSAGGIDVWVTGSTSSGIARLRIDQNTPAPMRPALPAGGTLAGDARDDMLIGGSGADTLLGGAGRDILVDGAGTDWLSGGLGADIFVLAPDGATDWIVDFEPGIDKLDLSAFGVRGPSSVTFVPRDGGIEIRIATDAGIEILRLSSVDGRPIASTAFTASNLSGLWHVPQSIPDSTARYLQASPGNDTLVGRDGDDTLVGIDMADMLLGRSGDDLLLGGSRDESFDAAAASISRLYRAALGRAPDDAGHFSWTMRLANGENDLREIASGFLGSPEFARLYGNADNTAFVALLYANVLGRAPDPAGLAGWLARMQAGMDRTGVVLGFSESAEFQRATAAAVLDHARAGHQMRWADEVFRLYGATLGRRPDEPGLLNWTEMLSEGATLRAIVPGFLNSVEFATRYGSTTDTAFVTLLYSNVLGRVPDPGGLADWLARMQAGLDRAGVVLGFSESVEFQRLTAEALSTWMQTAGTVARLEGGAGNDTLAGGVGADIFVFSPDDGAGIDRVAGLERWDWIDLTGFGYVDAEQAMARFSQQGTDIRFQDGGLTVLFEDTLLSEFRHDMLLL